MNDYLFELHTAAMDFMDDAEQSRKKGDIPLANTYWEKAWWLERSYALAIPNEPSFQLARSITFRSAVSLAIESGKYQEAIDFAEKILTEAPHPAVVLDIKALLKTAKEQKSKQHSRNLELIGRLISADILFNQIKIEEEDSKTIYAILVTNQLLNDIVKSLWAEKVVVVGVADSKGVIRLEDIRKAA